jgi:AAA domain
MFPAVRVRPMSDVVFAEAPILNSEALRNLSASGVAWLWRDFLARSYVTLLTSGEKFGKTTLLTVLLAKMESGGELAGTAVSPGRAFIISEESAELWADRQRQFNYGSHVELICRPFAGRPTMDDWTRLIDRVAKAGADLVVVDPLMKILPGEIENSAVTLLSFLEPLHRLTERGTAVLMLHHPRKSGPIGERGPRGSGSVCGFADVLMNLTFPGRYSETERRRRLSVVSRSTSARSVMIELNADGADYSQPIASELDEFRRGWAIVRMVFEDADHRLTRREMLAEWPEDYDRPCDSTLWRWLNTGIKDGLVECHGAGRRHDPFRYCLPGQTPIMTEIPPLPPMRMSMRQSTASATNDDTADAPFVSRSSRRKKRRREKQRLRELAEAVKNGMVAGGHMTADEAREISRELDDDLLGQPDELGEPTASDGELKA